MKYSLLLSTLALFTTAATASLHAGQSQASKASKEILPPPVAEKDWFSGDFTVVFANQYNTRGIIVQDDGLTIQPQGNVYFTLYEGEGFINKVQFTAGFWADFSTEDNVKGEGSDWDNFTEFDIDAGFIVQFAKRFTLSSVWNGWTSPSDAYGDGHFINSRLSFDDSGIVTDSFSIKPYFVFLYELPAEGYAGLAPNAWYFEPGINPNFNIGKVNIAVNAKFGLGDKFYAGEAYGYFAVGPQVTVPVTDSITASAGYRYYNLGETLEPIQGSEDEHLFTFSVSANF
jgi:hypothetical protein